jgi:hypothetical protein
VNPHVPHPPSPSTSRPSARALVLAVTALVLAAAGCGDDPPPDPEDAVRALEIECQRQLGQVEAVAQPETVAELEQSSGQAFGVMRATRDDLDEDRLRELEDEAALQRYLEAADGAIGAMSEVSLASGQEDTERLTDALERAESHRTVLDEAAADLELPDRCGAQAWGGTLFDRAGELADG